jgi:hypothetical protein
MMHRNEIHRRLDSVERSVQQITEICHSYSEVSEALLDCVQQLNRKTSEMRQELQSDDDIEIYECVDELEQLSDRAKEELERASTVDEEVRIAILQTHNELSSLKHQLH